MEDRETFLTTRYVMVDDLCKSHQLHLPLRPGPAPALSCSEVLTLSLFGQWARFPSARGFDRFAHRHLRAAFPTLSDRSQFLRHEHACVSLIEHVACLLAEQRPPASEELYQILDATGGPVRSIKRRGWGRLEEPTTAGAAASVRTWASMGSFMAITPSGFLTSFGFSPASVHDTRLAETFLAVRACPSPRLPAVGQAFPTSVADRGFASEPLQLHWLHDSHAAVLTQPHNRKPVTAPSARWRRWMHGMRPIIESVSGKWPLAFRLATDRLHTMPGFRARLAAKVGLHTFCCWLNLHRGRPAMDFADLIDFSLTPSV